MAVAAQGRREVIDDDEEHVWLRGEKRRAKSEEDEKEAGVDSHAEEAAIFDLGTARNLAVSLFNAVDVLPLQTGVLFGVLHGSDDRFATELALRGDKIARAP
jgi:hypothetical protein